MAIACLLRFVRDHPSYQPMVINICFTIFRSLVVMLRSTGPLSATQKLGQPSLLFAGVVMGEGCCSSSTSLILLPHLSFSVDEIRSSESECFFFSFGLDRYIIRRNDRSEVICSIIDDHLDSEHFEQFHRIMIKMRVFLSHGEWTRMHRFLSGKSVEEIKKDVAQERNQELADQKAAGERHDAFASSAVTSSL
ncbi:unnamed protein product [Ilex paraguariensis]|uniref:Uncharacterized protein n=1 Tax=Ilex paraguariensis TaxID=185542 RepID=A0ABC8U3V3_9AQUA